MLFLVLKIALRKHFDKMTIIVCGVAGAPSLGFPANASFPIIVFRIEHTTKKPGYFRIDLPPVSYPGGVFRPARYRTITACHAQPTVAPIPLAALATALAWLLVNSLRCSNVTRGSTTLTLRISSIPTLYHTGLVFLSE